MVSYLPISKFLWSIFLIYTLNTQIYKYLLYKGYKGASDLYIDANIQLALSAGKQLHEVTGKKVHVCLPDEAEYNRAKEL